MKVVQKGKEETYSDFYPDEYEFKLCGGSIQPKDRIIRAKDGDELKDAHDIAIGQQMIAD